MTIRITAKIEGADQTADEFKQARREIYRRTKRGIKAAGEKAILPLARRGTEMRTPVAGSQIVVKTTASDGYLTTANRKSGRIVGLLNFGGALGPIEPKRKKAIAFGGVVVAQVTTARRYKGKHFLEKAREQGFPLYSQILLEEIMHAFDGLDHTP